MSVPSSVASTITHSDSESPSSRKIGEHGITSKVFFFTCCNALISQALSTPYMFTTAGWISFLSQALTVLLTFISTELLKKGLQSEQILAYGDEKGVSEFEREYTFLAEYCGGRVGRVLVLIVIFLNYFASIATIIGAIGVCGALMAPAIKDDVWIIIFSLILFVIIIVPWLKKVAAVMGVLAVIGTIGTTASWVGTSTVILPDSHVVENMSPRQPLMDNIIAAISLSVWASGDLPSLNPFLGCVKGMQLCDGPCDEFYPASLNGIAQKRVPLWLVYSLYIFILLRMLSMAQAKMVAIMLATEKAVCHLLASFQWTRNLTTAKAWRLFFRLLVVVSLALAAVVAKRLTLFAFASSQLAAIPLAKGSF
ncbi:hypothetical protein FOL47_011067 [Perkinsus chesapeaki]|uniref:Uncharacterized protein n=1 Tax=Perkinsus chesapeaki TaxID=330153 RepID=A0A7J6MN88_PERCH|nr:hypothetical protein FOL47_011067 [Perkinsus chesapeaki]